MTITIRDPIVVHPITDGIIRIEPVVVGKRLFSSSTATQSFLSYDSFTRANGSLGSSESTGPEGESAQAIDWSAAGWSIADGAVQSDEINTYALQSCGVSDVTISVTVRALAEAAGICARCNADTSPNTMLSVFQSGDYVFVWETESGGSSPLGEYESVYSADDVLKLILSGTSWQVYKNDALLGSGTTAITSGTIHGMFSSTAGDTLDNWTCRG